MNERTDKICDPLLDLLAEAEAEKAGTLRARPRTIPSIKSRTDSIRAAAIKINQVLCYDPDADAEAWDELDIDDAREALELARELAEKATGLVDRISDKLLDAYVEKIGEYL